MSLGEEKVLPPPPPPLSRPVTAPSQVRARGTKYGNLLTPSTPPPPPVLFSFSSPFPPLHRSLKALLVYFSVFQCILVETIFYNNVVTFGLNVTKFVFWLTLLKLTSLLIFVAMETILAGNYEFLIYQNICIYKMAWRSMNITARVLNHKLLARAGHISILIRCGEFV